MTRNICVVTGGRMDYGHLKMVLDEIKKSKDFDLTLVACCMHLTNNNSLERIKKDGFNIDYKVDCLLESNTPSSIAKAVGLACISFADCFEQAEPDLLLLMGDRFELLAAAQTALFMKIPIAHMSGGDTTEGAYDESIRHSITKMSHIHFATNKDAYRRILQLGEDPNFVYNVGSPSIDYLKNITYISRTELESELNIKFKKKIFLVTYHPTTLGSGESKNEIKELLDALSAYKEATIIITQSNSDNGGLQINKIISDFVSQNINWRLYDVLGQYRYYNLLNNVDVVIGNSSSGLFEAPSFNVPTVNIGDRQKGRIRSLSVIDCECKSKEIAESIDKALNTKFANIINPYGNGDAAKNIVDILGKTKTFDNLVQKHFHDYE